MTASCLSKFLFIGLVAVGVAGCQETPPPDDPGGEEDPEDGSGGTAGKSSVSGTGKGGSGGRATTGKGGSDDPGGSDEPGGGTGDELGGNDEPGSGVGGKSSAGRRNTGGAGGGGRPVGAGGSAGRVAAGGSRNRGGGSNAGGAAGRATGTGGAENAGGTSGGEPGDCTFTQSITMSTVIPTVGAVEWSVSPSEVSEAKIEFGLDTNYGLTAPVDLKESKYRTLLLGMKPSKSYHYRIIANVGGKECTSPDYTTPKTGAVPTNLPKLKIDTKAKDKLAPGFIVMEAFTSGPSFILDIDGEPVWWYGINTDTTRTKQSYDGKYMWICKGNVPKGTAKVVRLKMDGTDVQDFSRDFANLNHDFAVLPDETVGFIAYGSTCDDVKERSPSGTVKTLVNLSTAFSGPCHANAIHYSPEDDTFIVSELDHNAYVKVSRQGKIVWVLGGGSSNQFTGDGASWTAEHGFHILGDGKFLYFNNGAAGAGSHAIELKLDESKKTATKVWDYAPQPSLSNNVMGDVQRLGNGNTLVNFSTQGVIHEVDANKTVLQTISGGIGAAFGYSDKRESLYGPPPR